MPSLVNRVPPGLLSLLGIKALGVNPSVLGDELTAELDVTSLYLASNAELLGGATNTLTAPGVFPVGALLVPAGELWVVNRASAHATANLAAATTYRYRIAVYDAPNQRIVQVGSLATGTVGERLSSAFDEPIVMPAGEQLVIFCEQATLGTAQTMRIDAKVTRLVI